jgi:hypothetical protein
VADAKFAPVENSTTAGEPVGCCPDCRQRHSGRLRAAPPADRDGQQAGALRIISSKGNRPYARYGRIPIAAAQKYHVNAVGVEISSRLARTAEDNVKAAGLEDRVKIVREDFMHTDLSAADVVTLYLMTTANENLRPKLEKYLKKDARVVSYDFPIPGWKPISEEETGPSRFGNRHTIYLYQVPTSLKK